MTKFNEIRELANGQQSIEVPSTDLPNYIGSQMVWQERMSLSLTYGEILSVVLKGRNVIVTVSKYHFGRHTTEKMSLTFDTMVVIRQ